MIDKLKNSPLNLQATSVYNFNEFSLTELLNKFFSTINQCVDSSNTSLEFLTWLKGEGLPSETIKELNKMYNDGRLKDLVDELGGDLTNKIENANLTLNNKVDSFTNEINNKYNNISNQVTYIPNLTESHINKKEVKIIGHRGLSRLAPENTIPSYYLCGSNKLYGGEADINTTKDDVWVLLHDDTVDRTTNGFGNVSDLTLEQIKSLTIIGGYNVDYYPNLKIPTFEEYLICCKDFNIVPIIEIKNFKSSEQCLNLVNIIKTHNMESSCIVISFSDLALKEVRKYSKKIPMQYIVGVISQGFLDICKEIGNCGIDSEHSTLTKELVDLAHSQNIPVNCWTVNDYARANTLKSYGVDFITTDLIGGV